MVEMVGYRRLVQGDLSFRRVVEFRHGSGYRYRGQVWGSGSWRSGWLIAVRFDGEGLDRPGEASRAKISSLLSCPPGRRAASSDIGRERWIKDPGHSCKLVLYT